MIGHNLKWFLGLSAAVHTAALVALVQPEQQTPGASSRTLLLSVNERSGNVAPPSTPAVNPAATEATPVQPHAVPVTRTGTLPEKQQPALPETVRAQAAVTSAATAAPQADSPEARQATTNTPTAEERQQHLRASLMAFIARELNYPPDARNRGCQGVVKLELQIESDGHISDLHIKETSGYSLLDKAAMRSLQLAHVPDAAQWLDGKAISIIVPVEYRLIKG